MRLFFSSIKGSEFFNNFFKLSSGIVLAQVLPILFYPLLSRIYTPSDFGLLATASAIVPILSIISSGMYESAILVTKDKQEAANLVGLVLFRSSIFSIILILSVYFFSASFLDYLNPGLEDWLIFTPLISFFTVIFNCYNEWCVRNKYFSHLAINKIFNTSAVTASKVIFGFAKMSSNGLVLGDIVGKFLSSVSSTYKAILLDKKYFSLISINQIIKISKIYSNFPRVLMADQIFNNLGGAIHIFFIGIYFNNDELGYVSMAMSLLTVPVTVISAAIKDVFRQKAIEVYAISGNCRNIYLRLLKPLIIFGFLFFGLLYFIMPTLLIKFLGPQWSKTATYSLILLPMFYTNFVSMSLGGILILSNKLIVSLYWQILTILLGALAFIIGIFVFKDIVMSLVLFSFARTITYILYGIISYYFAKSKEY